PASAGATARPATHKSASTSRRLVLNILSPSTFRLVSETNPRSRSGSQIVGDIQVHVKRNLFGYRHKPVESARPLGPLGRRHGARRVSNMQGVNIRAPMPAQVLRQGRAYVGRLTIESPSPNRGGPMAHTVIDASDVEAPNGVFRG